MFGGRDGVLLGVWWGGWDAMYRTGGLLGVWWGGLGCYV